MYNGYQALRFERDGSVLTVTISNPAARNAINGVLHEELALAFAQIARDREARVVVLTGDPAGRAFCAGGEFNWLTEVAGSPEKVDRVIQDGTAIIRNMLATPQPIIGMVNGAAVGLGATLALHCDITYMDEAARIADPHVGVGVVAGDGGAVIWPLLIGPNRAKEFLMTGDPLTGREAAAIGLVNHALPAAELTSAAYAMARRLAEGPRLAIEWTKRSVNLAINQLANTVLPASLALEGITFCSSDHREALRALLAKEKPRFGQADGDREEPRRS